MVEILAMGSRLSLVRISGSLLVLFLMVASAGRLPTLILLGEVYYGYVFTLALTSDAV